MWVPEVTSLAQVGEVDFKSFPFNAFLEKLHIGGVFSTFSHDLDELLVILIDRVEERDPIIVPIVISDILVGIIMRGGGRGNPPGTVFPSLG